MTDAVKKARPEFRNINVFNDVPGYRLPLAGLLSILHRVSGFILFLMMPFIVWMFDKSLSSEFSFAKFKAVFNGNFGWALKLVALGLIWAYLHHFFAGMRHIRMDLSHDSVTKEFGLKSAQIAFALSLGLTVILGAKLFGLY